MKKFCLKVLLIFVIATIVGFLIGCYHYCSPLNPFFESSAFKMVQYAFYGALEFSIIATIVYMYAYLLYKLFSSKNNKKIILAIAIVVFTVICVIDFYTFWKNFYIPF